MSKPRKMRLDEILAQRGMADSRAQARLLIMAGKVRSGTQTLDKPGKSYPEDIELEILQPPRFVSRGGEKLLGFLETYPITVEGTDCLDVGASTGGFTDCLLQHGARSVVCLDVGRAQLHGKILNDPRITNLEGVNARTLDPAQLPRQEYDIIVMDLSFISLKAVLPSIWPLLKSTGNLVALVKPQFEAGKEAVDKGKGVIRDPEVREAALQSVRDWIRDNLSDAVETGLIESPIRGAEGNIEYLLGLTRTRTPSTSGN